ncbi:MAG TPA: DegT/DnrJ/EryC1/StrS family aminotransferase, partial [Verrucomicrobiae bacterium]|nr:DegT/DnrJ/EryC1/StrS family aminotransferase [Verrucomicrobiae bacterium]
EERFAAFAGTKYALTTSSGTTGLHLALVAAGIGPGDEVIIPDFTFVATANAVQYTGAAPVCVDIDEETLCLDPRRVESAITGNTRAVMPVHAYGHPADMKALREIADRHGLFLIEDAAESHGAEVLGKRAGGLGDCGVFSFYGNKIITSGEGGMITTDDEVLYERMKLLRDHAMDKEKRYWHGSVGFNYRMTNLQAALGVAQLERIDAILARKREIFRRYSDRLARRPGVRLNREASWARNVYWMVCVEVEGFDQERRDELMRLLRLRGVDSRPYFYPVSDLPMYNEASTPVTHAVYRRGINLPSYFDLGDGDIDFICSTLIEVLEGMEQRAGTGAGGC